jgi:hypothetical protein
MTFARAGQGWRVVALTNQSTGYCPDHDSWPAVDRALGRVGVEHPDDFTDKSSSVAARPAASATSCETTTSPALCATAPCPRMEFHGELIHIKLPHPDLPHSAR